MANVSDLIKEQNHYERELAEFMCWEFVEGQKKGSSYDCITSNGQKVELKMDWGRNNRKPLSRIQSKISF